MEKKSYDGGGDSLKERGGDRIKGTGVFYFSFSLLQFLFLQKIYTFKHFPMSIYAYFQKLSRILK